MGSWIALEIHDQGFFQILEDRRSRVGPRFLELPLDPTATPLDYVLMDWENISKRAEDAQRAARRSNSLLSWLRRKEQSPAASD
jgi:hypothetical protein